MPTANDYWRLLELKPCSDLGQLKRAYREQAKAWHPDRFPYDETLRNRCTERMRLINEAYRALRTELEAEAALEALPEVAVRVREPEPELEPVADLDAWTPDQTPAESPPETEGPPAFASLSNIALAFTAAGMALGAVFVVSNPTSQTYWQTMRLIASPALGFAAVAATARGVWELGLGLGLLALALNPVLPVPMSLEEWRLFNAVTPPLLIGMWFWLAKRSR